MKPFSRFEESVLRLALWSLLFLSFVLGAVLWAAILWMVIKLAFLT